MAVAEFAYEDLRKLADYSKEKVIEGLTELGAPTEERDGDMLVVEVTPNRPDLFFIEGVARALNCYFKGKKYDYKTEKSKYALICDRSVASVRPVVRAAVVTGVQLDAKLLEYLINAQEKLHETVGRKRKKVAIGIHDLDTIEFPLVYRAVEDIKFVPLDFAREMGAKEILAEHPKGREYAHLVPGKKPIIEDKRGVVSFPPIINSERTKLNERTKNLLIEITGTHEETVNGVLNMLVCALADRGGTIHEVMINGSACPDLTHRKMKFNLRFIAKTLGIKFKAEDVKKLLAKTDYEVQGSTALVPPYRMDVFHEVDVIEDIAIAYGYNNFETALPDFFSTGRLETKYDELHEIMRGMGFSEVKTFTLTNDRKIAATGYADRAVPVLNPASEDYGTLKPGLLVSMLEVLGTNKMKGLPQRVYEIGEAYGANGAKRTLCFAIVDKNTGFSEGRGAFQTLVKESGWKADVHGDTDHACFDTERSGTVRINGKEAGRLGEVRKEVLAAFGIEFPVCICEITLS